MANRGAEIVQITYDRQGKESDSGKAQSYLFGDQWVWLPKSQIELDEEDINKLHIPRWLAEKNDLENLVD